MCGRCSGHRDAISLSLRSPAEEVVKVAAKEASVADAADCLWLAGHCHGWFPLDGQPLVCRHEAGAAEWLVDHDIMWPLDTNAPWWLLTHYPDHNDVFSWLDGMSIIAYMLGTALVIGSGLLLSLSCAVRLAGAWRSQRLHHLAQSLIPLAGIGVFLGLSALTVTLLKAEGIATGWANDLRLGLLLLANAWSLWLAAGIVRQWQAGWRSVPALVCVWRAWRWWMPPGASCSGGGKPLIPNHHPKINRPPCAACFASGFRRRPVPAPAATRGSLPAGPPRSESRACRR
jgi:hypothetical protein